jgi:N-carbamoyl-L-amino-acid hydrolase
MTDAQVPPAELRVDADRLWGRIEALGEIGAVHGPSGERGCARLALTDEDGEARDLVLAWMRDLGLAVSIDAIGNVIATRGGTDPGAAAVMTGSHIDTVRTGGRFDGNLGVLAGLEVIETLERHGVATRRPISVGFFTDEEGARFAPDMLGSLVYVGGMPVEEALDVVAVDGARLGDELDRIGYAGPVPCPTGAAPHAFVELHIEQGPILEAEQTTIGAVTGVQGISWTELTVTGQSAHAGTTPMRLRHDAGSPPREIITGRARDRVEMGGRRSRPSAGATSRPTSSTSSRLGDDDGRPAQHRGAPPAAAEATVRALCDEVAARRGVTVTRAASPGSSGGVRHRDGRPRRGDGHTARSLRAADAIGRRSTMRRCSPASARRR